MARLGDIAEISAGQGAPQGNSNYCQEGIPFVKAANLLELLNGKPIEDIQKVPDDVAKKHGLRLFTKGTVLFAKSGMSCLKGYVYALPTDAYVVNHLACITPYENISDFLVYYFAFYKPNQMVKDAAYPSISLSDISNMEIDLKSHVLRSNIVSVLDKLSNLISLRKQQLAKLDELVKARFVEMFGDPISNPMNWVTRPLGDECSIITGNTPSRKVAEYYGDYIEWIKSDNINTPQAILTVAEEGLSKEGLAVGRAVDAGSILMTCIAGSIGCIGNVAIANRKVAFNQQINGIIPNNNNVWFMYIQFELSKKAIQSSINMALKGILSKGQLSEMRFVFPPIKLQNEYGHFAAQIDKSKLTIQQSLDKLEVLKKSLMQEYFG